jgi:hypothetical protein
MLVHPGASAGDELWRQTNRQVRVKAAARRCLRPVLLDDARERLQGAERLRDQPAIESSAQRFIDDL